MQNAIGQSQTILLLGGTSDIGRAIVRALDSPTLRTVVLAVRNPAQAETDGLSDHADVVTVAFDATDHRSHAGLIDEVATTYGDLDIVIQAFGQLGTPGTEDPVEAAELAAVNYAGAVSSGLAVADRLRSQGHGVLIVLSSVAGVRTRPSNYVYGSTKAGQDAFATGLGHALHGSGAHVVTVRPGFVRSAMTEGMDPAPFAVDPDDVAAAVVAGLRRGRSVVWAPAVLQYVLGLLRFAPGAIWRRLDR